MLINNLHSKLDEIEFQAL